MGYLLTTNCKTALLQFLKDGKERPLRTELKKIWRDLYPEDKEMVYQFIRQAKQYKLFMYFWVLDLQNQSPDLPWHLCFKILDEKKIKISDAQLQTLCESLRLPLGGEYTRTPIFVLESLYQQKQQQFMDRLAQKKSELLSSAQIAQAEQLDEQYSQYMSILNKIYPGHYLNQRAITQKEKNMAEKVLQKVQRKNNARIDMDKNSLNKDEKDIIKKIKNDAQIFYKQQRISASDLAFLFRSLGDIETAIHFLDKTENSDKKDWQQLDYLMTGDQNLMVLSHCESLKKKYANDPDALFSILYTQSQAYWKLGEKDKAQQLMEQISLMRPDYKSVDQILKNWREDSFD